MAEPNPSRLFFLPELLEPILLNLDMHTLLTSARTALFFIPEEWQQGQPRRKNPLIIDKIWPEYFRRDLSSIWFPNETPPTPPSQKAKGYQRPEASWRKMLLHQPPTPRACFIETFCHFGGPVYSFATWGPSDGFNRMKNLEVLVDEGILMPAHEPFLLRTRFRLYSSDDRYEEDIQTAVIEYLDQSDFIVLSLGYYFQFLRPRYTYTPRHFTGPLDKWVARTNTLVHHFSPIGDMWDKDRRARERERVMQEREEEERFRQENMISSDEDDYEEESSQEEYVS